MHLGGKDGRRASLVLPASRSHLGGDHGAITGLSAGCGLDTITARSAARPPQEGLNCQLSVLGDVFVVQFFQ